MPFDCRHEARYQERLAQQAAQDRHKANRELKRIVIAALCFSPLFCCAVSYGQNKQGRPPNSESTIRSRVSVVLVPVVVRDSQGHTVGTLNKQDFSVLDDGKERTISGFSVETRGGETGINVSGSPPAMLNSPAAVQQPGAPSQRFVVLMFDDMHMDPASLDYARGAATKMLQEQPSGADMFAVLTTSGSNSGLTRDHEVQGKPNCFSLRTSIGMKWITSIFGITTSKS